MTAPDAANRPANQRTAPSGAVRDSLAGKGRYDLIHPLAIKMLADRMEEGADHYGERNWEKGQPLSWFVDSGKRHLDSYILTGNRADLAGYLWNAHGLAATAEMIRLGILPPELDDLPHYLGAAHVQAITASKAKAEARPARRVEGPLVSRRRKGRSKPARTRE